MAQKLKSSNDSSMRDARNVTNIIVSIVVSIIILGPVVWLFYTSFRHQGAITSGNLVGGYSFEQYARLFTGRTFEFFRNSVLVAVVASATALLVTSAAAYSLSRFRFRGFITVVLVGWTAFVIALPQIAMAPALFVLEVTTSLYNSVWGLAIVYVFFFMPVTLLIVKAGFDAVPKPLLDAAELDCRNDFNIFAHVMLPLAAPAIISGAIVTALFCWSDFQLALTLTANARAATLPVEIAQFVQDFTVRYGEMAAAGVLAVAPVLSFIVFGRRYLVFGATRGAVNE